MITQPKEEEEKKNDTKTNLKIFIQKENTKIQIFFTEYGLENESTFNNNKISEKKKCFTEFCLKYSRTKIASTLIYFCDGGAHKPSSHPPRASVRQKAFILRSGNIATPTRPLHLPGALGRNELTPDGEN